MLKKIVEIDRYLFLKINHDCQNSLFDAVMPLFREPKFWAPLYLFMLIFIVLNFGKKAFLWLTGALVCAAATDFLSSKIIKPFFARPRPCMDVDFMGSVRLVANYCGTNGSFTSSHAANHFGLALFFVITLKHLFPKTVYLFFLWAVLVCFAQIYVGVHYPTDILGGALLGTIIGGFMGRFYNNRNGLLSI